MISDTGDHGHKTELTGPMKLLSFSMKFELFDKYWKF